MPAAEASVGGRRRICMAIPSTIDNFLGRVVRESFCTAVMRTTDREAFAKSKAKRFVGSVASTHRWWSRSHSRERRDNG